MEGVQTIGRTVKRNGSLYNTIKCEMGKGGNIPMQIFLRSNISMGAVKISESEIIKIAKLVEDTHARVYVHSPYVYNFCNPELDLTELKNELIIASRIGALGLVIHVGKSCKYTNPIETMFEHIVDLCNSCEQCPILCPILLETPAGQGTETLITPEEFGEFYMRLRTVTDNVRICVDTCHVFATGYDPLDYIMMLCNITPLENIKLIHLNDSVGVCGCKTDRHAPVGTGEIGVSRMNVIIQFIADNYIDAVTE
jgi:deoxyribonuclease IV